MNFPDNEIERQVRYVLVNDEGVVKPLEILNFTYSKTFKDSDERSLTELEENYPHGGAWIFTYWTDSYCPRASRNDVMFGINWSSVHYVKLHPGYNGGKYLYSYTDFKVS